jgi:tetratricopeptide (TPR) repeat protein
MGIEERPEREETLKELERIASRKTFLKHHTLVEFLRFLVNKELNGETPTEHELGVKVFGKPEVWRPDEETVVRENTRRLKGLLNDYYSEEGLEDRVKIELKGRGRKPRFSYNPERHAGEQLRRIVEEWDRTFLKMLPRFSRRLVSELESLIQNNPDCAPAYAVLAEVLLTYTMCDDPYDFPAAESIRNAERAIGKSLKLNDKFWKAHVIDGALYCCRFNWDQAERSFKRALELEADETRVHFFYRAYLLAMGNLGEYYVCETLARSIRPYRRMEDVIRGLYEYITREFNLGHWHLVEAAASWDYIEDENHYTLNSTIPIADSWLVNVLMACFCLAENSGQPLRYAERGMAESQVQAFYGIVVICYVQYGAYGGEYAGLSEAAKKLVRSFEQRNEMQGSLSLALSYMALGRTDDAIAQLRKACGQGNPFMAFLHLWPIFDPLREREDFKAVISQMQLPAATLAWADDVRARGSQKLADAAREDEERRRRYKEETKDWD